MVLEETASEIRGSLLSTMPNPNRNFLIQLQVLFVQLQEAHSTRTRE